MQRQRSETVHGPYKHGNKWRVVISRADRRQTTESFKTEAEAERVAAAARAQSAGRTLSHAVDQFLKSKLERGLKASTTERDEYHLEHILRLKVNGGRALSWLTVRRGDELYELAQADKAVDTHRHALSVAKQFSIWCKKKGWLLVNPFAEVEGVGMRKRGKPQLHIDESRKLIDTCIAENSRESLAVAIALLLGLRASEVAHRQVRDLDDGGRIIWVPKGKTPNARRHLEVPEVIRGLLLELVRGRAGSSYLFGVGDLDRPTRRWVAYHCERIRKLAKVPRVTPHGLRGTQATLAVKAGATSQLVAAALGHGSAAITEAAYIDAGERERTNQAATLTVLRGGRS